jgi:hypothetical protein
MTKYDLKPAPTAKACSKRRPLVLVSGQLVGEAGGPTDDSESLRALDQALKEGHQLL